jgi:hypothetical protein
MKSFNCTSILERSSFLLDYAISRICPAITSPLAFVALAIKLWPDKLFRWTAVFFGRCLKLNSDASLLLMY